MTNEISILRGIHPGFVLDRKLKERKLRKRSFALSIDEYPQTLSAITKGKRSMNIPLALKVERALGLEEGYFMTLQVFYDIKEEKRKRQQNIRPNLSLIRPILFWDTDINKIDWETQRKAVIERIIERGNDQEKEEIRRFYGEDTFQTIAENLKAQHA
ncbi:MAG: plasmid maintenance system antidote protein [Cyclobacteriaceae bacterium]|nr:plasmid maintenance system antidote protein [Cyclobacteriaceae bacterium]